MPRDLFAEQTQQPGAPRDLFAEQPSQSWGDVAGEAAMSFLPSVGHMLGGIGESVMHPIDTATNIGKLVIGAGEAGAGKLASMIDPELTAPPSERELLAGKMGEFYKQRYGSMEGFKQALSKDPAGVMADAATVLSGGGLAVSKLPMASELGAGISRAGAMVDPLALTAKAISGTAGLIGKGAKTGLGVTTGAGSEAIGQAYQAGKTGGETAESFRSNLRGDVPMTDVINAVDQNLAAMNAAKTAEYRSNMRAVSADKTVLDLNPIGQALNDAFDMTTFKGQVKNEKAADVLDKMNTELGNWSKLDPAEFHTPEGLDALKQRVGGIIESIPFEEKTARMAANKVYNAIKGEISKQAPVYAKTMKDYHDASELVNEIKRTLSNNPKASIDTQMRKLQSLTRNNVSTNYGNRLDLVKQMEEQGGKQIMPALAGQALGDLAPRGLARIGAGVATGGAFVNPMTLAALPLASPRIAGEASYYAGKVAGIPKKATESANKLAELLKNHPKMAGHPIVGKAVESIGRFNPRLAANLAYQAQQPKQ